MVERVGWWWIEVDGGGRLGCKGGLEGGRPLGGVWE